MELYRRQSSYQFLPGAMKAVILIGGPLVGMHIPLVLYCNWDDSSGLKSRSCSDPAFNPLLHYRTVSIEGIRY